MFKTAHTEQKIQTISPLSLSRRCCNLFFSCFAYVTRAACNGLVALLGLRKGGETAPGLCGWPQPPACTREGTGTAWMGQICCQPPGFKGFHFLHPPSVRTPGVAQELWYGFGDALRHSHRCPIVASSRGSELCLHPAAETRSQARSDICPWSPWPVLGCFPAFAAPRCAAGLASSPWAKPMRCEAGKCFSF